MAGADRKNIVRDASMRPAGPKKDLDTATWVMAELAASLRVSGHALVVDDRSGEVAATLGQNDMRVERWVRQAGTPTIPQPWVPDGVFDLATLRLSRGRDALHMVLCAVASKLRRGGRVFVYGRNDEGVRAAAHVVTEVFGSCDTLETKRHARVVGAVQASSTEPTQGELERWRTQTIIDLPAGPVPVVTYPGLFARGRLDPGTRLLIESLPPLGEGARILDFGCGIGVIGLAIRQRSERVDLHMIDADALAIHATRQNAPFARSYVSDAWEAVGDTFDLIASNPPFHAGTREDMRIIEGLVSGAPTRLAARGKLIVVAQRRLPVGNLMKVHFRDVASIAEDSVYRVWSASS